MAEPAEVPLPDPKWSAGRLSLLVVVTALAVTTRLWQLEQSSWHDAEPRSFQLLSMPAQALSSQPERWYPLLPWLLHQLDDHGLLPSHGEGWLRLPFAFLGALTVPLLALVAAPVIGVGAAVLAALLLALHPWHIDASQTMAPAVVVAAGVLLVLGLLQRRRWWLALVGQLVVAAVHPLGWIAAAAAGVAVAASRLRSRRWLEWSVAAPAAVAAGWWLADVRPATLALVAVAACRPQLAPAVRLVGLALVTLAGALVWAGGAEFTTVGLPALPVALALAAAAAVAMGEDWQQRLSGRRWLATAAAALVATLAVVDLGIETWLRATLHDCNRPAWRAARDVAFGTVQGPGGLVVIAASGAGPLRCYLRPNDGREPGDPHPGVQVQTLALDAAEPVDGAGLDALAALRPGASCILVLRAFEAALLQREPLAAQSLQRGFEMWRVLSGPRQGEDDTLFIYRRRLAVAQVQPKTGG